MRHHRTTSPVLAILLAGGLIIAASAKSPMLADDDRIRIAEGRAMAEQLGDRLWPGWSETPFTVLLVTKTYEFLIGHPSPSPDFEPLAYDSLLQSDVFCRKRVYDPHLLATFPAVGGMPTIVIGQPQNTPATMPASSSPRNRLPLVLTRMGPP